MSAPRDRLVARVPQRPDHAGRVRRPALVRTPGVSSSTRSSTTPPSMSDGVQAQHAVRAAGDRRQRRVREGEGHDEAVVVVGVLADQVDPARRRPHALRRRPVQPLEASATSAVVMPSTSASRHVCRCRYLLCRCANSHASATIPARSDRVGFQPSRSRARSAEATRTAGSPPRRGADDLRDRVPGDLAHGLDDLADREAVAVAEVADEVFARGRGLEGQQVGVGQVGDVDVVAYAGAVRGRVVVAVDGDRVALALGDLEDEGDQVGLGVVALAAGCAYAPATLK